MTALTFAIITFVTTSTCAWLGTVIRQKLPEDQIGKDSQDVVRLGMGLVATMTALLLGLVTAAAKGSFDSQDTAVKSVATNIITLDRMLARYGPETAQTRDLLRRVVEDRVQAIWPEKGRTGGLSALNASQQPPAEQIEDQILRLVPNDDAQRWYKDQALSMTQAVLRTRWQLFSGSSGGSVSKVFLGIVIFWLGMTFASFGLSAPRNATVMTVFLISALSVAAAIFLIFELDSPFEGIVKISSGPMRQALAAIGR
jgi:hypothetical protein